MTWTEVYDHFYDKLSSTPMREEDKEAYMALMGLYSKQEQIVRCKDCKWAVLTVKNEVKYCRWWQANDDDGYEGDPLYLEGDFFCAAGARK